MRTRLYLDFDGVINAWYADRVWKDSEVKNQKVIGYTLVWAQQLVEELDSLDIDLVWCTTWTDLAPTRLAPMLNFEKGKTARFLEPLNGRLDFPTIDWKKEAVWADQQESPSPFIWLDDELKADHAAAAFVAFGRKTLVLPTNPDTGITPADIRLIKNFIERVVNDTPVLDEDVVAL